jgi:genome maintenance exonuclease 1
MQGAAYAGAHNEMYGTDITNIAVFMCSRAGEFQLFEVDTTEFSEWELKWAQRLEQFYNL